MIGLINQRRPGSACSRKSSLIRFYTNCSTSQHLHASECKSLRGCRHYERAHACVCVCVCGEGGKRVIIQN